MSFVRSSTQRFQFVIFPTIPSGILAIGESLQPREFLYCPQLSAIPVTSAGLVQAFYRKLNKLENEVKYAQAAVPTETESSDSWFVQNKLSHEFLQDRIEQRDHFYQLCQSKISGLRVSILIPDLITYGSKTKDGQKKTQKEYTTVHEIILSASEPPQLPSFGCENNCAPKINLSLTDLESLLKNVTSVLPPLPQPIHIQPIEEKKTPPLPPKNQFVPPETALNLLARIIQSGNFDHEQKVSEATPTLPPLPLPTQPLRRGTPQFRVIEEFVKYLIIKKYEPLFKECFQIIHSFYPIGSSELPQVLMTNNLQSRLKKPDTAQEFEVLPLVENFTKKLNQISSNNRRNSRSPKRDDFPNFGEATNLNKRSLNSLNNHSNNRRNSRSRSPSPSSNAQNTSRSRSRSPKRDDFPVFGEANFSPTQSETDEEEGNNGSIF